MASNLCILDSPISNTYQFFNANFAKLFKQNLSFIEQKIESMTNLCGCFVIGLIDTFKKKEDREKIKS